MARNKDDKIVRKTENEIAAFLGTKISSAMNDEDGDLSQTRKDSLNYYLGKNYGTERDGYSSHVTREVLEAIEWAMPAIVRVFTAGDKVVQFDPVNEGDEAQADIETDTINHLILKENNGFETIYQWIKDALMYPNGYVKLWVDDSEVVTTEKYQGLSDVELAMLVEDDSVEVIEQDSEIIQIETPEGMVDAEVYSVKIKLTTEKPRLNFEAVEPEQVLVDSDLTSQDLDQADFVAHRVQRTYTWLVQNGYDRDKLDQIGDSDNYKWNDEKVNRLFFEDESPDAEDTDDESMRQFWVHECYVKMDVDGDGIAEGRRIVMIGSTIFEDEEMDYQPFVSMSSILMSHKHTGLSLADLVKDIQLVNSTLWRQMLDNVYRMNIRRKYVGENALNADGSTMDALLDNSSEFVPCRDATQIQEEVIQPIIDQIMPVISSMRDQAMVRSGVSQNSVIDPATLQQSTFGAVSLALDAAGQRIELITRVFAETGFRRVMQKAHRLSREFMDHELQFKLGDEWMNVNPSDWRDRTTMTINVGLGFNDKSTKIQLLATLLEYQKQALGAGMATPDNIYNTMTEMVEAAGLGDVSKYFTDPADMQPQPPQPDPVAELAKAQIESEGVKAQTAQQKAQADAQLAKQKLDGEQQKAMAEIELKRYELELKAREMEAKQHQHNQDTEIELLKLQNEIEKGERAEVKEEISELDQQAANYLRGEG
jgi:hypothetical protein